MSSAPDQPTSGTSPVSPSTTDPVIFALDHHLAFPENPSWTVLQSLKRLFAKSCRDLHALDRNCFHANRMGYLCGGLEPIMIAAEDVPEECRCSCLKTSNECFEHRHYVKCFDKTEKGTNSKVYCVGNWEADVERKTAKDKVMGGEWSAYNKKIQDEKMKKEGQWLIYVRERDGENGGIASYGPLRNVDVAGRRLKNVGLFGAIGLLTVVGMLRMARNATK